MSFGSTLAWFFVLSVVFVGIAKMRDECSILARRAACMTGKRILHTQEGMGRLG